MGFCRGCERRMAGGRSRCWQSEVWRWPAGRAVVGGKWGRHRVARSAGAGILTARTISAIIPTVHRGHRGQEDEK